jgi:hypothetical protein
MSLTGHPPEAPAAGPLQGDGGRVQRLGGRNGIGPLLIPGVAT